MLAGLPYAAGQQVNLDFAGRIVAACRAACRPCQESIARKVVERHRPTLAALAGAVYGLSLNAGLAHSPVVSATTRSWAPPARTAAESGDGTAAYAAVEAMPTDEAAELLEDALDHWALGGIDFGPTAHGGSGKTPSNRATHAHPEHDSGLLEGMLPYVPGWETDLDLAAKVVSACWAGCASCRATLAHKAVADRATLAGIAGAVFLTPPRTPLQESPTAGPAARAWIERAHGEFMTSRAEAVLRAVADLDEDDAEDLLNASLDIWAASAGAVMSGIGLLGDRGEPRADPDPQRPIPQWNDVFVRVVDPGLPPDPEDGVPRYAAVLTTVTTPRGEFPMLSLECETAGAGFDDLRRRTGWRAWDARAMPGLDFNWRLRVDIASQSLQSLVHVDEEGFDEYPHLWDAGDTVRLPDQWWNLVDRVQHVLVAGPIKNAADESALTDAARTGELLAVAARVSFM